MGEPSSKRAKTDDEDVKVDVFTGGESENLNGEDNQKLLVSRSEPQLLPENWKAILEKLSPADYLSAINTCPNWSELVHYKKSSMLFPLVLPILISTKFLQPLKELHLRKVSKIYKQAMDTCLQRNGSNPSIDFQWSATPRFTRQGHPCDLNTIREVEPLLTRTESWLSPMGNPFLSGCVTIKIQDGKDEESKLRFLLGKFGHHITNLKLRLPVATRESTISTVISILNMNLPNLKMLRLEGKLPGSSISFLNDYQQHFPNFEKLVSLNLNSLRVSNSEKGIEFYLTFLQKYGSQLNVFYGDLRFFEAPEINVSFLNEQLPNVQMLDATVNVEGLEKLSIVDWNLKALRLNTTAVFEKGGGLEGNMFINVLRAVNNFSETLTYLHLDFLQYEQELFSGPKKRAQSAEERNELRVLEYLEQLQTTVPKRNLGRFWDFLEMSCPNLKWLHFIVQADIDNARPEVRVKMDKHLGRRAFAVAPRLRRIWFRRGGQKVSIMERGD